MHNLSTAVLLGLGSLSGSAGFLIRHFLFPKLEAEARKQVSLGVVEIAKDLTRAEDKTAILAVYAAFKAHFPDAEGALPAMVADALVARVPQLRLERDLILKELTDFQGLVKAQIEQAAQPPVVLQPPPPPANG